MQQKIFRPKLWEALKNYNRQQFTKDLMAGMIVGIVALPLSIAFGVASGVSPEKGIITAIVAGVFVSLFGGSKVQISGPTGAFIVIVSGILQEYGTNGLIVATMMAGILLILMGAFKLGTIIRFIPYPIIIGFNSGIAMNIFTTQIGDIFGLQLAGVKLPTDFVGKWLVYIEHFHTVNWANFVVTVLTIFIILYSPKLLKKVPPLFVAIIVLTVGVYCLKEYTELPVYVETIGDRFRISSELPTATIPPLNWEAMQNLISPAITIALLGAIVTLLSATVADGALGTNDKHDSNTELIGQGIANVFSPLFGGIPITGAIARTMANINNGGRTPVAGIVHAAVLFIILIFLIPLAQYIPMAVLAGILVMASYNMSGWRVFKALLDSPRSDVAVLLITFFLTVLVNLTVAIELGLIIACVLFIKRVMETTQISVLTHHLDLHNETDMQTSGEEHLSIPEGVEVYEIDGPYFFGVATKFEEVMAQLGDRPKIRIIRMRRIPFIDSTGIYNLTMFCRMSKKEGIQVILSGVNEQVHEALHRSHFYELIGEENICSNINIALEVATQKLQIIEA